MQTQVAKIISRHAPHFALVGGTALSWFHLKHRYSYDLDFFAKEFDEREMEQAAEKIRGQTDLAPQQSIKTPGTSKRVWYARYDTATGLTKPFDNLKIDFVEDVYPEYAIDEYDGIRVYSAKSIYYRKLRIACGDSSKYDDIGRGLPGSRQVSRDMVDLYFLSNRLKYLPDFLADLETDGLATPEDIARFIRWVRTFPRQVFIEEVLDMDMNEPADARKILTYMDQQVREIIRRGIRGADGVDDR